ncbi:hypothetical protein A2130_01850 [Candidatus Woesebacteria bacterium GWC2_33_12]|uniref:Uncharacterized protein n=1 Tax=Candidatus Woesebacteria bacterium GW2011_GWB1_33_22 TaxID=1618566 RepID=A0A0G0C1C2_9BACT|nr:MAG: hypothetical protein UR29_C0003G0003 [Candidatus Woesebacteria bacterium GW2011_GWC2_33_12]KKP42244.1 MAG: hypothetical protein UR33_C0004G0003 [Candidatus Woesebacteria bacterium GW2011_GWA2_33_20]KKP44975.1 MAG: hypothetical protein UR35_C0004G0007 [Candidatus Woesebacteria bacterium GW2011_GWB1_33_22]KKP46824.1 MAG: hypothetical protein UR37_C0004G0003 [Microgenomates group bacterium GW2011_GWC1_33_28]KKP50696.1 MAG: hypothetical protein UR41_C0004G0007 [Candidatus Woesebacteria bact
MTKQQTKEVRINSCFYCGKLGSKARYIPNDILLCESPAFITDVTVCEDCLKNWLKDKYSAIMTLLQTLADKESLISTLQNSIEASSKRESYYLDEMKKAFETIVDQSLKIDKIESKKNVTN